MAKGLAALLFLIFSYPLFGEISTAALKDGTDWLVTISNSSSTGYRAMIVSSNPDYRCDAGQISVAAGAEAQIRVRYIGEPGQEDKHPLYLRLISDHPENPGIVTPGRKETTDSPNEASLLYFYTPDCSRCRRILDREIPAMEKKLGVRISLSAHDVTTPEGLKKMMSRLKDLGSSETRMPVLIGGKTILAGEREIESGLVDLIRSQANGTKENPPSHPVLSADSAFSLQLLPVFLAGLLDGINPCAFTTLIFLLSWLTLAGRRRREILITGVLFTAAVFTTYYAVGLGAFAAVRTSGSVRWIGPVLKYAMAAVLLILTILHLRDYGRIRSGRISDMSLQLSRRRKRKIHSLIREKTRKAGLFAGSLILGSLVTVYELGCTGQIYLPTLMYMTRLEKQASAFALLGLYNFAFILPLIALFAFAWKGTGSEKLARWFSANVGRVKLISALFFLAMAALLVFL